LRESHTVEPRGKTTFLLSLVTPMYNEADVCGVFFSRVLAILEKLHCNFEIICVNDGSQDGTLAALRKCAEADARIKVIDLSRNFGKDIALSAGLDHARGDAIVPIDVDLQDPPELIPEMLGLWQEGHDVVLAIRGDRTSDTRTKRVTAGLFYRLMRWLGDIPIPAHAGDFRLMDRSVVDALKRLPERTRFMKGLFAWLGFRQTAIYYTRPPRAAGDTKWKPWKLWNFALDGVVSFTTLPLRIWTYLGFLVALFSLGYLVFIILRTLMLGVDVPGYASILSVVLLFSGFNMIGLGFLGEYIGRIFVEVKQRPLYLIRETIGFGPQGTTG
jgi:glycosyltransferase involved in cell wall biosynthesis